jgi:hypothetical protein
MWIDFDGTPWWKAVPKLILLAPLALIAWVGIKLTGGSWDDH